MINSENPYLVFTDETGGAEKHYVSFFDGNGDFQEVEVDIEIYIALEESRKHEKRQNNFIDRHVEHSSLSDENLLKRAMIQPQSLDDYVMSQEESDLLYDALNKISPRQFYEIYLYYWENKSFGEIGELLGHSARVMEHRIEATKKKIREYISK